MNLVQTVTLIGVIAASHVAAEELPVFTRNDQPQVDHAALCARHDLIYLQPAIYSFEAMHLGNGNLGVCLWNADGLTWQFNNGNYRLGSEVINAAASSGKVTLTTPALSQTKPDQFEQRVNLWDGTVTTKIKGAAGSAEGVSFVAEGEDVFVFHYKESGAPAGTRELTLHLWPSLHVPSISPSRSGAHFVTGPDFVALTEHADHADPTEAYLATDMAMLVKVDGAKVKVGKRDDRTLTLTFTGTPAEYTVYIANPLTKGDALQAAQAAIARVQAKGYRKLLAERQAYWHDFWAKSFIHITDPTGEGDFLENLRYLFFWDLASMSRNTLCPKFNGGNWLVAEDSRSWGGRYWSQNTREIFWPVYAANHAELADPFFELYWRMTDVARARAKMLFGVDGLNFYECVPLSGGVAPTAPEKLEPSYGSHILTIGAEVALQAWWRYEYTGDETFLRTRAYPLLKGALEFYLHYAKKGADGKYHLEPANAQESFWAVKDPHTDLAALRWGLPVALAASAKLNVDADLRPRWQDLLDNLAPFPVDEAKNVFRPADLKPTDERHNNENIEDYGIYPFGVFGIGLPDYERAKNTFLNRHSPSMAQNGWEPAAICAARLGLADEAAKLELEHLDSMRFNNGSWYSPTIVMFAGLMPDCPYYDAPGVSAQALNEMALQSHNGILRIAPAWPKRWAGQFRLRARGGFMVTAETHQGEVRYALIESEWGSPCKLANPWKETALVTCAGKELLRSDKPELAFATQKGKVYRVERASQPLAKMKFAPLKPQPNRGTKSIAVNNLTYLGIDANGQTPQRTKMLRDRESLAKQVATNTTNLVDLSTGKAQVKIISTNSEPRAAAALVDGIVGPAGRVEVVPSQTVVLDLGEARTIQVLLFSIDRTGLYVFYPVSGYVWECSLNGTDWTVLVNAENRPAVPLGQFDSVPPTTARYLRLKATGLWNNPVLLDEVTVFGSRAAVISEMKMPAVFSDGMVVQRGIKIPVWGWATPGEQVKVTLKDREATATADPAGDWKVLLDPVTAGGPFTMTVAGSKKTITINDVLVGEVWVCAGQSWMQWEMYRVLNATQEVAAANYPQIRMFTPTETTALTPQKDCPGAWAVCTPKTVSNFSGAGYFFARQLHQELGVPVGMINPAISTTLALTWTDRASLENNPVLKPFVDKLDQRVAEYGKEFYEQYGSALRQWLAAGEKNPSFPPGVQPGEEPRVQWSQWLAAAERAKTEGKPLPLPPGIQGSPEGKDPRDHFAHMPTLFYNGMIKPLMPYGIAGFIWYQGGAESPGLYRQLFPVMIQSWRRGWGQGDVPFLFVQRANYNDPYGVNSVLAEFREAQAEALKLPKTGMTVSLDIGRADDLHPLNMQDVGKRLALAALGIAYGKPIVYSGPIFDHITVEGDKVRVHYKHVGGGLVAKGAGDLKGFVIAGQDLKFVPATAVMDGETVVVSSDKISQPVAVRYAWAANPNCNLYNAAGLPAAPFRTDAPPVEKAVGPWLFGLTGAP